MFHSGEVVRTLREARGWSQKMLAAKAGVSDMTISKMERSSTNYRRSSLPAVARALEIIPAHLILPPPPGQEDAEHDQLTARLLTLWEALRPEHREAGLEALEVVVGWSAQVQQLRTQVEQLAQQTHDDRVRQRDDRAELRRLARREREVRAEAVQARGTASTKPARPEQAATGGRRRTRRAG